MFIDKYGNERFSFVDMGAGAGGLTLGLEQAGGTCVLAIERDPIHAATHEFNFPETPVICADIHNVTPEDIRDRLMRNYTAYLDIDVIAGGMPCQSFSQQGKRDPKDDRATLVGRFFNLAIALKPKYILFENVEGLATPKFDRVTEQITTLLDAAEYTYYRPTGVNVQRPYMKLNAAHYDVAQRRKRVFVVATRKGLELPAVPARLTYDGSEKRKTKALETALPAPTAKEAIGDLPNSLMMPGLFNKDSCTWIPDYGKMSDYGASLYSEYHQQHNYGYWREWDNTVLTASQATHHKPSIMKRFAAVECGTKDKSRLPKLHPDRVFPTLLAGSDQSKGAHTAPRPIHWAFNSVVTNRMMCRASSFPDWFRPHVTKFHGARQIGNAVPPRLARAIGFEFAKVLDVPLSVPFDHRSATPRGVDIVRIPLGDDRLIRFTPEEAADHFKVDNPIERSLRPAERPAERSAVMC